jgi:hypothetical protein
VKRTFFALSANVLVFDKEWGLGACGHHMLVVGAKFLGLNSEVLVQANMLDFVYQVLSFSKNQFEVIHARSLYTVKFILQIFLLLSYEYSSQLLKLKSLLKLREFYHSLFFPGLKLFKVISILKAEGFFLFFCSWIISGQFSFKLLKEYLGGSLLHYLIKVVISAHQYDLESLIFLYQKC